MIKVTLSEFVKLKIEILPVNIPYYRTETSKKQRLPHCVQVRTQRICKHHKLFPVEIVTLLIPGGRTKGVAHYFSEAIIRQEVRYYIDNFFLIRFFRI